MNIRNKESFTKYKQRYVEFTTNKEKLIRNSMTLMHVYIKYIMSRHDEQVTQDLQKIDQMTWL